MYWKVPFIWSGERPVPEAPRLPPDGQWQESSDCTGFLELVAECLPVEVDPWFASAVADLGARRTAELVVAEAADFEYLPAWWKVLVVQGRPAGVMLPVLFPGCAHGDLEEGTILF